MSLVAFVLAVGAARSTLADHYYVPTGSMIPTVEIGDRVVVNKLAYGLRIPFTDKVVVPLSGPRRGDVVILKSPEDGITLLKRVVALPGDQVAVMGGHVWINGAMVPTNDDATGALEQLDAGGHQLRLTHGGGVDFGPVRVGADQYLVLGDNRGESHDGRAFGLVERKALLGRALSVWMRNGSFCWHRL